MLLPPRCRFFGCTGPPTGAPRSPPLVRCCTPRLHARPGTPPAIACEAVNRSSEPPSQPTTHPSNAHALFKFSSIALHICHHIRCIIIFYGLKTHIGNMYVNIYTIWSTFKNTRNVAFERLKRGSEGPSKPHLECEIPNIVL